MVWTRTAFRIRVGKVEAADDAESTWGKIRALYRAK